MPISNFPYGIAAPGIVANRTTSPLALPQTGTGTLFTIAGGPLKIEAIFGIVTVAVGSATNTASLQFTSTATSVAVALCAASSVASLAAGTIYSVTGTLATAAIVIAPNTNNLALDQVTSWHVGPGVIQLLTTGSDGGTGRIQWFCRYRPYSMFTPTNPTGQPLQIPTITPFG